MSVASKVKEFIETCSFLEEFEKATFPVVNLNLLEENPTMYSIEETRGGSHCKTICKWGQRQAVCVFPVFPGTVRTGGK